MANELRPYQVKALNEIERCRSKGLNRLLMIMPTGTGKTITFSKLIADVLNEDKSTNQALVVAHREELLDQGARQMASIIGMDHVGVEAASRKASRLMHNVIFAGVQTIGRQGTERLEWLEPDVVVLDEAHHAAASSYQCVMARYNCYGLHPKRVHQPKLTLGCTATPHRMDNRVLYGAHETAVFQEVAFQYTLRDAIRDKFLVTIRGYTVRTDLDLSNVKTTAGDFNQKQLAEMVDTDERNLRAMREWLEVAKDRKTIVFCVSVEHAEHMAKVFQSYGFKASAVTGETDNDERRATIAKFASGEIQVLTNVMVLTEGFDEPSVECVLMMRPTQSWALYTQMVGRGTRLSPDTGKEDLIVIDVEDNCRRHNLAAIPAILGLPPRLSLKGRTLEEAAAKVDALGEKLQYIGTTPEEMQERLGFADPATLEELESLLEQVDLLATVTTPASVQTYTNLMWLQRIDGGYSLRCGYDREIGVRRADLKQDTLGRWWLRLSSDQNGTEDVLNLGDFEMSPLFQEAEKEIQHQWPGYRNLCSRSSPYVEQPPTEKQVIVLRRNGVSEEIIANLNKMQASTMLDNIFGAHK
jgi:superfamily II DNA or RNA helicase